MLVLENNGKVKVVLENAQNAKNILNVKVVVENVRNAKIYARIYST